MITFAASQPACQRIGEAAADPPGAVAESQADARAVCGGSVGEPGVERLFERGGRHQLAAIDREWRVGMALAPKTITSADWKLGGSAAMSATG